MFILDYAGTSCQLIKDHCADLNPCKHDGKCVTNLIGFKCECDDGKYPLILNQKYISTLSKGYHSLHQLL